MSDPPRDFLWLACVRLWPLRLAAADDDGGCFDAAVALPGFESDSVCCEPEIALKRPIGMEYNRVVSANLFPLAVAMVEVRCVENGSE